MHYILYYCLYEQTIYSYTRYNFGVNYHTSHLTNFTGEQKQ